MALFDTHAHYDDPRFDEDRLSLLSALPEKSDFCPCGVEGVVNQGCDLPSSRASRDLAERFPFVFFAAGVHPEACLTWDEDTEGALRALLAHPKAVAVGEIGLDRHWEGPDCPLDVQKTVFAAQLSLARELKKPVCVHDREAHGECFDLIRAHRDVTGVMHAFSGSPEMARQLVDMGWYIGIGGSLTFKGARVPREVAAAVPADRILLETDCPYLAPVPWRGSRNDSRKAYAVAALLGELRGVSVEEILAVTAANARRFFGL